MFKEKDEVMSSSSSDDQLIGEDSTVEDRFAKLRTEKQYLFNNVKVYGALNRLLFEVNKKYPYLKGEMYDLFDKDCTLPGQMWLKLHADCGGTFCWHVHGMLNGKLEKEG